MIQIHTKTIKIQSDFVTFFDSGILAKDIVDPPDQSGLTYFIPHSQIHKIYYNGKDYTPIIDGDKLYAIY